MSKLIQGPDNAVTETVDVTASRSNRNRKRRRSQSPTDNAPVKRPRLYAPSSPFVPTAVVNLYHTAVGFAWHLVIGEGLPERQTPTHRTIALAKLYDMAWGKPWPHMSHGSISEGEITGRVNENDDDVDGPLADILHVPKSFNYSCFKGMQVLRDVFGAASGMDGALVVREEYGILLKALEED